MAAFGYLYAMLSVLRRIMAFLPLIVGTIAVLSLVPLMVRDAAPALFPSGSHDVLGAAPLFAIAVSYFAQILVQKPPLLGWMRAAIVVAAFIAWAANQCSFRGLATLWNDIAIVLFVIDVFLPIAKGPGTGVAWPLADAPSSGGDGPRQRAPAPSDSAL